MGTTVPALKCKRCKYVWVPRDPEQPPVLCPNRKCRSPYWRSARVRPAQPRKPNVGGTRARAEKWRSIARQLSEALDTCSGAGDFGTPLIREARAAYHAAEKAESEEAAP